MYSKENCKSKILDMKIIFQTFTKYIGELSYVIQTLFLKKLLPGIAMTEKVIKHLET